MYSQEKQEREDQVRIELAIKESLRNKEAAAAAAASHPEPPTQAAPQSAVDDLLNLSPIATQSKPSNNIGDVLNMQTNNHFQKEMA